MRHNSTAGKVMWALSVIYGVTVAILGAFHGPVGTFAWIGAIALGLGWSFISVFGRRDRQDTAPD
jgi:hypothetical protein